MSNADGEIVPIVEDDQGEGYQDLIEDLTEFADIGIWPHKWEVDAKRKREETKEDFINKIEESFIENWDGKIEKRIENLEEKVNRILVHFGIGDKSEILVIKDKKGG